MEKWQQQTATRRTKVMGKSIALYMSQVADMFTEEYIEANYKLCIIDPMSHLVGFVECGTQLSDHAFVQGKLLAEQIQKKPIQEQQGQTMLVVRGGVVASSQWGGVVDKYIHYYSKGINVVVLPLLARRKGIYISVPVLINQIMDHKNIPDGIKPLYDFAVFARSIAKSNLGTWEISLGEGGSKLEELFRISRSFWLVLPNLSLQEQDKKELVAEVLDLPNAPYETEENEETDLLDKIEEELQKPKYDKQYDFSFIFDDPLLKLK